MVVIIMDTAVRPARWTDAPNTDDILTTIMNTADMTINTVIAMVPAKQLSARTGLIVGTTVDGIIGSKTRESQKAVAADFATTAFCMLKIRITMFYHL